MSPTTAIRVEAAIDAAAAAMLAGAIGFAAASFGAPLRPLLIAAGAFALTFAALRRVSARRPRLSLARFDIAPIGEHLFACAADDALLLDDALPPPDPDSRVVQLFDPARTPGEIYPGIDRYSRSTPPASASPDASLALSEALRDLRRSLS